MSRKFFILFLGLLVACSGGGSDDPESEAFIGGSEGLALGLVQGSPPETVQDNGEQRFSVSVALENVGESDVGVNTTNPFVYTRLIGLNMDKPEQFNLEEEDLYRSIDTRLRGARKNFDGTILPGDLTTVTFDNMSYRYGVVGSAVYRLQSETCYDYTTHANMKVCLKRRQLDKAEDASLCDVRDDLEPRSSGAPLQLVKGVQRPVGTDKVRVRFSVQNVGNGRVYSRAADSPRQACGKQRHKNGGDVLVAVEPLSSDAFAMDCPRLGGGKEGFSDVTVPEGASFGTIELRGRNPFSVMCTFTMEDELDQRVVQDLLDVHLYYRYLEAIDVPIVVQEAEGYDVSPPEDVDTGS